MRGKNMFIKSIYEINVKKISSLLSKDLHMREDLQQEMLLEIFKQGRYYDKEIDSYVLWVAKNRAIDYIRKFNKKEIPYGSMNDIDNLLNSEK